MIKEKGHHDRAHGRLRRARLAASLLFLISGYAIGTWTACIPSVKHSLGLSDAQLSVALAALAVGGFAGMTIPGKLADRHGNSAVLTPAALALGVVLVLPGYAPNLAALVMALLAFGLVHGTLNVAMNANAVHVQRAYRRPIMTSMHALFSIGGACGAAAAGLLAHRHDSATTTLLTVGAGITVVAAVAGTEIWHTNAEATNPVVRQTPHPSTNRRARTAGLGLVVFCSMIGEGIAADWSTVYLHDSLGSTAAAAAAAYGTFAAAMTLGRLFGDKLVDRLRPVPALRLPGLLAGAGSGVALLSDRPAAAILGFGCLGLGLACVVPQVYVAAANLDPAQAGRAISRVAAIGYLGYVIGPVLIGAVASQVGLAKALLILPITTAAVAVAARVVGAAPAETPRGLPQLTAADAGGDTAGQGPGVAPPLRYRTHDETPSSDASLHARTDTDQQELLRLASLIDRLAAKPDEVRHQTLSSNPRRTQ